MVEPVETPVVERVETPVVELVETPVIERVEPSPGFETGARAPSSTTGAPLVERVETLAGFRDGRQGALLNHRSGARWSSLSRPSPGFETGARAPSSTTDPTAPGRPPQPPERRWSSVSRPSPGFETGARAPSSTTGAAPGGRACRDPGGRACRDPRRVSRRAPGRPPQPPTRQRRGASSTDGAGPACLQSAPVAAWRLTAETTALREAVTMLGSMPTPQRTWSSTAHSTYAAATASPPEDSACSA